MQEASFLLTNIEGNSCEHQVWLFTVNEFAHRMAGIALIGMKLLLFSFIRTGVQGEDGLILAERYLDIFYPCKKDLVCFHIWHLSTSETSGYIGIVGNGQIRKTRNTKSKNFIPGCSLQIKDLPAEEVEHHLCRQRSNVLSPYSAPSVTRELNVMPGKVVSLQCVLLSYVQQRRCYAQMQQVSLAWVDEDGAEIQEDSQYLIRRKSSCDITLTTTFQSPEIKKFRCQATVDEQVHTSVELQVRCSAFKGRGRGLIIELEPENQGSNQDSQNTAGVVGGLVGCMVLTVLVAAFVVNRRRTRTQLRNESCYTISTNNVMNADDVVYAEIILPVGCDKALVHERESTEYACVQHK